ncbi:MAG: hypothetical protein L0Y57_12735 [Beijerinckiaceae bacterium]|nr:hypothetical protein [Beijerinckiaceae bacterium]
MPIVRMKPPASGRRNAVLFSGRMYVSTPDAAIDVYDFDVAVLESNGWRQEVAVGGLQTLSVPYNSFLIGAAQGTIVATIANKNPNSTLVFGTGGNALSVPGSLQISGNEIQVGPTPPGTPTVITFGLVETLAPVQTNGLSASAINAPAGVPVNTAVPTIDDTTPTEGQLLTGTNGTWTNSPTGFAYQWFRNGSTAISGATAITYTPVTADVGQTLSLRVTASNGSGSGAPAMSAATSAVAAAGGVPVNTVLPAITGTAAVAQTLSVSNGTWTNTPAGFTYQWKRAGVDIAGAAANSYALIVRDQGKAITCAVTASNGSGSGAPATSAATAAVISELAAITVPTANLMALYSMIKTNAWAGNCIRVRRSSDNTEQDIGFAGNVVDWAAADSFTAGANLFVTTWYDQSGNARDLTQATQAQQPQFNRESHRRGVRPWTQPLSTGQGTPARLLNTTGFNFNTNSFTIYLLDQARNTRGNANNFDITSAAGATSRATLFHGNEVRLSAAVPGNAGELLTTNIAALSALVVSSGVTAFAEVNGADTTISPVSSSQVVDGLRLGDAVTFNFGNCADYFFCALYDVAHDAATVDTNRAAFVNGFVAPPAVTSCVVYGGSSLITSSSNTKAKTLPYVAGFGRLAVDDDPAIFALGALEGWDAVSCGIAGRMLETEDNELTGDCTNAYNAALAKNVYVMDAPSNDFVDDAGTFDGPYADQAAAEAAADNIYNTITLPFVSGLIGLGYDVVVPTCIPRSGFDQSTNFQEYARLRYNTNVRNGAVANNYTVSDRCSVAPFNAVNPSTPFDQTYYAADDIHCRDAGYALLAQIDRTAILAA